ncbi:MAG: YceI family protein [Bacteroidales bacterium]|nr:YceI family protein [Bacteroidales bacterium]
MKTKILLILAILAISYNSFAQKLIAKNGHIWFYSHTPVEDIEAHNRQVVSILDPATGEIQFSLLVKSFEFEKKLMEEHFNENYMESDEYPKSSFKGQIANIDEIDLGKDGSYKATINGQLTIHGVTKEITTEGKLDVKGKSVSATSKFAVSPSDYDIDIPNVVEDKIAKEIEVNVNVVYSGN